MPTDNLPAPDQIFDAACRTHGHSHKAAGWASRFNQQVRYTALTYLDDFSGHQILDVGCGQGDLVSYLRSQGILVSYTGIDVSSEMIRIAQETYPDQRFIHGDFFTTELSRADYVIASGAFNLKVPSPYRYIEQAMAKMLDLATTAIGLNVLSIHAPESMQDDTMFFYYDPVKVFEIALTMSPFVALHHNYLVHDFTLFIYK